jgi:hypothetical protein
VNWKRTTIWSLVILLSGYAVAVVSALTMVRWENYGESIEAAVANARLLRLIGYFVVAVILYWRFAAGTQSNRALHVLVAFAIVQIVEMAVSLVLGSPVNELVAPWDLARSFLAAAVGLAISYSTRLMYFNHSAE